MTTVKAAAAKKTAATAAKIPAAAKKPADRKSTGPTPAELKKQKEAVADYLATGVDFTPFTIDIGDGIEWAFKPDLMPKDMVALRRGLQELEAAKGDLDAIDGAFDDLVEIIKTLMVDEAQKPEFPKPLYGMNAITWLTMTLIGGRTGFPTE